MLGQTAEDLEADSVILVLFKNMLPSLYVVGLVPVTINDVVDPEEFFGIV